MTKLNLRLYQFDVQSLMALAVFLSAVCSIAICTDWWVALIFVTFAATIGTVVAASLRKRRGFLLGTILGIDMFTIWLGVQTVQLYWSGRMTRNWKLPLTNVIDDSSIKRSFESAEAKGLSTRLVGHEALEVESLAGRYHIAGARSEGDLYFFPDGSYYYLVFTDVHPLRICDRGTWTIGARAIILESDGTLPSFKPSETVLLPLTPLGPRHCEDFVLFQRTCFLPVLKDGSTRVFHEPKPLEEIGDGFPLSAHCWSKTETISISGAQKIKNDLYLRYRPTFDPSLWRARLRKRLMACATLVALAVAAHGWFCWGARA